MKHTVYIGIGSNLGNRRENCEAAVCRLDTSSKIEVNAISNWHETKALVLDDENHSNYINGAVKISTDLEPLELLNTLKMIESKMGRLQNDPKWSDRIIDLDILLYDDLIYACEKLTIPHPLLEKRTFVLQPLCDIEPELIHPVLKKTVKELCFE